MKRFIIKSNKYLKQKANAYYNCEYLGYQTKGNPDFINHLKNNSCCRDEIELMKDFVTVCERATKDIAIIKELESLNNAMISVIPRSKSQNYYKTCQMMFKKAIKCVANNLSIIDGTDVIIRIKDTKTTHDWRRENNNGEMPYPGITINTCEIDKQKIYGKDIILVDDIYTEEVNIAEDCIQTLFDYGAKSVILYVIAKTRK